MDKEEKVTQNQNGNENKETNRAEKKQIIYLIIASLILIYIATFFIHNIIDRGQIKDSRSGVINFPDKSDNTSNNTANNTTDNTTNNTPSNASNNSGNNGNNTDGGNKTPDKKPDDTPIVDYSDRILVKQYGTKPFQELKELDMFRNFYFHDEAIIAPGVHGTYSFTVENNTPADFLYNITFTENNPYKVNMVYKIRLNGEYIVGSENEWKRHEDFTKYELPLKSVSTDLYVVEWKWEDADNDTEIGETPGANYKMNVRVDATQVVK